MAKKACENKEELVQRRTKFDSFLTKNLNLTKQINHYSQLQDLDKKFDVYICGSDQIWSPMLLSPSYYFDFVSSTCKKVSYACSFGVSSIPYKKASRIASYLKEFSHISVRESKGKEIVKNLIGIDVPVVADPTFLLNKNDWDEITSARIVNVKYMLCYFLSYSEEQWNKVIETAKEKGLDLIIISTTKETYKMPGRILTNVGPEDWISLIKYADFIATDSFYSAVFSIMYKKPFMIFKKFTDNSENSQNSRVYTLVETYGLENCLVNDIDSYKTPSYDTYDYDAVEEKVSLIRKESADWILNAIEN